MLIKSLRSLRKYLATFAVNGFQTIAMESLKKEESDLKGVSTIQS
jgi:hypothetical protein